MLLQSGASIAAVDTQGKTPLHEAAAAGQAAVLQALTDRHKSGDGALANLSSTVCLASKDGFTPLHLACKRGSEATVQQLLQMGADARVLDGTGRSLVHELCSRGDSAAGALKAVLAAGADADWATPIGVTPLHEAAKDNAHGMAQLLLAAGASADARRSDNGRTPLHTAAAYGSLEVLQLVLAGCSDPNVLDVEQRTALHLALEKQHSALVDELLDDARVDLTLATREGLTPLDMALQRQGGLDKAVVAKCARKSKLARKRLRSSVVAVLVQGRNRTMTGGSASAASASARTPSASPSLAGPLTPNSAIGFEAPSSPVELASSGGDSATTAPGPAAGGGALTLKAGSGAGDESDHEHGLRCPRSCSECGHLTFALVCSTALDVDLYGAQACLPERYQRYMAVLVQLYEGVQHFIAFVSSVQLLFEYAEQGTGSFSFIAAVLLLVLVVFTDVATVYSISHLAYDTAELLFRMFLSLTGMFPLALALGMESLGKDESRLFAQFLAVEGFGAALPQLLLLSGFIMSQASASGGELPSSSALWLGVSVNVLSAAAEITATRLQDVSSPTVPGLLEDVLARSGAWQSLAFGAFFLLTALETSAAVILYGVFGQTFGALVAVAFLVPVLSVLCYAAWRLHVHKKVRTQYAYTDGTSVPVVLLYYAVMSIVSGAGVIHGFGNARSDPDRQQLLALNNSKVGTKYFDRVFLSVYFRTGVFLVGMCAMAGALLGACPAESTLCNQDDWQAAIYACLAAIVAIQAIFVGLLLHQRTHLAAHGPTTYATCTAARQADHARRARLGLGTATRQMNIARSGGTTPILPNRAYLTPDSSASPPLDSGEGGGGSGTDQPKRHAVIDSGNNTHAPPFDATAPKQGTTALVDTETGSAPVIDDSLPAAGKQPTHPTQAAGSGAGHKQLPPGPRALPPIKSKPAPPPAQQGGLRTSKSSSDEGRDVPAAAAGRSSGTSGHTTPQTSAFSPGASPVAAPARPGGGRGRGRGKPRGGKSRRGGKGR